MPHLRRGLIAPKVGIARRATAFFRPVSFSSSFQRFLNVLRLRIAGEALGYLQDSGHLVCLAVIDMDWTGCSLIEVDTEEVNGAPVFKRTRLPLETITDNIDAYMEEGLSPEQAISETLENFPSTPRGAECIQSVLEYRAAYEHQLAF